MASCSEHLKPVLGKLTSWTFSYIITNIWICILHFSLIVGSLHSVPIVSYFKLIKSPILQVCWYKAPYINIQHNAEMAYGNKNVIYPSFTKLQLLQFYPPPPSFEFHLFSIWREKLTFYLSKKKKKKSQREAPSSFWGPVKDFKTLLDGIQVFWYLTPTKCLQTAIKTDTEKLFCVGMNRTI